MRSFRLAANGTLGLTPLSWKGTAALDGNGLDVPGTAQVPAFHLTTESAALSGTFRLDLPHATLPSAPAGLTEINDLHLDGSADRREVRIASLSGSLPGGRTVAGSGRFTVDPLLSEADLDLHLVRPVDAVRAADVTASLRQGVLRIEAPKIDSDAGPASFSATVPLGGLRAVPQLSGALACLPFVPAQGPVVLHLAAPSLDSVPLLAALGLAPRPERMRGGVEADLAFDPAAPAAGHGTVRLDGLNVESPDGRVRAEGPVTLQLGEGRLDVLPVRLRIDGAGLQGAGVDLRGRADLATGWRPFTDPASAAVRSVSAEAGGTLDTTLLNPYLQGGAASGILSFNATASGPLDGLTASARLSGPGASFFWAAPYVTRVQDPEAQLSLRAGRWTLDKGRVALNGGTVELNGGGDLGGPIGLRAILTNVRYRFDYGLSTLLSGRLSLLVPPKESPERMRLSGRLVVERGVLDRDVNLDREVLDLFLRPAKTPGTEETSLDTLDLDVQVATVDGVRIRNNVADLRASWRPIAITGSAATPLIQGQIDIDPGGLLFAYGQTVRIDRGAFVFTGDPVADPKIDLSTTSSLDDPTIGQLRGQERPLDILAGRSAAEEGTSIGNQQLVAAGLAGYLGERVVSRIGESVGLQHLSVRPLLVFGETDPSARLTVGGDLSRYASFALSVDLRNAQARTYLVDLHGFRELPGFALQGFTTDAGNAGASLQQTLDLGGSKPREDGPRLRRLRLDFPKGGAPKGISRFALRRAIRLEKRDLVPDSAAFDVEVDVAELLRRRGYPDPRVQVAVTPSGKGKVDVAATVEPGPHVTFAFAGDRPPRGAWEGITSLYRTDFYEPAAIEEMKKAAVRVFRSRGYLDPQVDIEIQRERPEGPNSPDAPRTVTVRAQAGTRVSLTGIEITGVDPESAFLVAGRFPNPLARTELAAALPGADRRLLDALQALGYPDARIAGRDLERNGRDLTVRIDAGPRQTLGAVTITGVEGEEQKRLAALLPFQPGEPARVDRASAGSLLLGRALAAEGYPDATVRTVFRPADPAQPRVRDLAYEVTPGSRVRVAQVGFRGERWTRQGLLARVAGLEPGDPFAAGAVEEARSRLLATGVFSKVTAEVDRTEGEANVSFSLTERPRFHLGYGLRSESGGATSGVLDLLDANFLGRAMTLGLRALYQPDDRSGRLYLQTGGLFGSPVSVEGYVESRRRNAGGGLLEDSREAALQIARPFGAAFTGRLYLRYRSSHLFEEVPDPFFPFDIRIDRPYLGLQALYDSRDDRIAPQSGLFASADLSGSGRFVGSDFSYARLFGQVNLYRQASLAGRPFTWAQSMRAGLARAFAGQELLRDERFFAGGAFSVRGYETESLGPRETLGSLVRPLGGEALFILNEELRFPLPYDLTGLLFADAGQVWKAKDINADLSTSLGFGLRARTPVGLLRLDVGFPLDRKVQSRSYKIYVGFGNAF
jgi:outer membrane protein assembly factor BamA